MLKYLLIILIFFCAYNSFLLLPLPFRNIQGIFHIEDVGIALICLGLFKYIFNKKGEYDLSKLINVFTYLIFIYLLFILLQVSYASMFYNQSIIDGLIRAREQLYYGSFFLFLLLFDKRENVDRFMNFMTILSILLICLALINYFVLTIFHSKFAEGYGIRSGIIRAAFPGISIILAVGLWHLVRYLNDKSASIWPFLFFLITYAAVIFRQTRGRIIALSITIIIVFFTHKKFKLLTGLILIFISYMVILSTTMEENILLNPFVSAYEEVKENKGNWGVRVEQMNADWELIKRHPFMGSGGLVIRKAVGKKVTNEMSVASYGSDLGYMSFIKYFGILGILWMIVFIAIFYIKLAKILKNPETDKVMAHYAGYMFTYIVIAEITLDSFYRPHGVILLCMTLAVLLNSEGALKDA